ncbi:MULTISPECIES: hypothetical protein [unclassified Pseudoalteromonas]|uniref:hypothetical protein n=1 Tax=unclassified Pseudoalteromonas TaxID=194690 RepID=UPI00235894D9|nr:MULTISPECIES: hypothetical protein [unclassified Pseudoalteromonas]MDC9503155.1 hypothetical protein [Pseudoalteromonas sp. Angola-18]MDC9531020.1 hypothetical protein [Pseudoalteromonas sp. Angola-7]
MSQVKTLPITATRWLSLLLCAITAATITVFLSKVGFVQKAYSSLGAILNANPVLHYSSALLAGIGIKLLLDKFYISHPKRSIGFNWRYPPVTIAVLVSLLLTALYVITTVSKLDEATLYARSFMSLKYLALTFIAMLITVIYQIKLYTKKPIFTAVLVALSATFIIFAVNLADTTPAFNVFMYLAASYFILAAYLLFDEYRQSKQPSIITEKEDVTIQVNPELNSLKEFQKWFADDRPIDHKSDLEPDLQVYADRIYNRLINGGDEYQKKPLAQHIALCGSFGCGKSSIVNAIANDLRVADKTDGIWIHSDISTWGVASGSVAHVLLGHIIDDISQYIDMCAFRALPKHYTEALKSGGSVFQFASTLLAGPIDIEGSFQKLNDVLEITNHKLLITLQDVDRGTDEESEKRLNDIAALLDRLKKKRLSQINFIIAMGNNKLEHIDVLSKVADHLETILTFDCSKLIIKWWRLNIEKLYSNQMKLTEHLQFNDIQSLLRREATYFNAVTSKAPNLANNLIHSIRMLKRIMRRVDSCWVEGKLLGEVDFNTLLLLIVLRETSPSTFNYLVTEYRKAQDLSPFEYGSQVGSLEYIMKNIEQLSEDTFVYHANELLREILDIGKHQSKSSILKTQKLQNKLKTVNYLDRIVLENLPLTELRDQDVINEFLQADSNSIDVLADKILSDERWLVSFERFESIFHLEGSKDVGKLLALALLGNSEADNAALLYRGEAFKTLLQKKCINSEDDLKMVVDKLPSNNELSKELTKYWKGIQNIL